MLALERRNLILEKLQAEKKVVVSELSQLYEVSEETIRRDLDKLEKEGHQELWRGSHKRGCKYRFALQYPQKPERKRKTKNGGDRRLSGAGGRPHFS